MTHINLTHRNWTAVGLPSSSDYPIVDPRGLVTPFYDSWSIDSWILTSKEDLIPSKSASCIQELKLDGNLAVETKTLTFSRNRRRSFAAAKKPAPARCNFERFERE